MPKPPKYRDENDVIYLKSDIERARKITNRILHDPDYLHNLERRAKAGVLAPAVEIMLWHYQFGKPKDVVDVNVSRKGEDLTKLSDEELARRAKELSERIMPAPRTDEPPKQMN